ncbi:MAG: cobalamin biosynthesis protein [Jhaorihella sp.]
MIVAGFGFRGAATVTSLGDALARTGMQDRVTALATALDKARAPAFSAFGAAINLPVHEISEDQLAGVATPTDSPAARTHRNTGSVAEASALCAAGPGARLLRVRVVSADRMATCAIACAASEGNQP